MLKADKILFKCQRLKEDLYYCIINETQINLFTNVKCLTVSCRFLGRGVPTRPISRVLKVRLGVRMLYISSEYAYSLQLVLDFEL